MPMKLEQRFVADEKSVVYNRTGLKGLLHRALPSGAYDYLRGANVEPLDGVDVDWLAPSEDGSGLVAASFHTANGLVRID